MRKVLFRADGSTSIGLGHVIRSLALAEMLKENFHCTFAIQQPSEPLCKMVAEVCSEIIILPSTDSSANDEHKYELDQYLKGSEFVVLDGYKFNTSYQLHIKGKGCRLVCIDDINAYHFVADVIINHGITNASFYSKETYTKLFAGMKYSLLRMPFQEQIKNDFAERTKNYIFLCFGGADFLNLTCNYLKKLLQQENIAYVHVVVGSAYQHNEELENLAKLNQGFVQVHRNIGPQKLVDIIRKCRVAIVPGSTIALECASTGIPIMCGYYVDNQHDIVHMLGEAELAVTVGDFSLLDESHFRKTLQKLLQEDARSWFKKSRSFFDGKTKERLLKAFRHLDTIDRIHIREAEQSDLQLFYDWANDPDVRRNAINEMPIPFENHVRWFHAKLRSPDSHLFVGSIEGRDFGQVRFDLDGDNFKIDYSVSKDMRGKGLGIAVLDAAISELQKKIQRPFVLCALVKDENNASLKVFNYLQFEQKGYKQCGTVKCLTFEKQIQ